MRSMFGSSSRDWFGGRYRFLTSDDDVYPVSVVLATPLIKASIRSAILWAGSRSWAIVHSAAYPWFSDHVRMGTGAPGNRRPYRDHHFFSRPDGGRAPQSLDSRLLGRLSVQPLKTNVALHFVVRLPHLIKNFAKCVSVLRSNPFGTNDPAEDLECRSRARRRLSALAKAKQVRVDGLQVRVQAWRILACSSLIVLVPRSRVAGSRSMQPIAVHPLGHDRRDVRTDAVSDPRT